VSCVFLIAGGVGGIIGELKERLLRTFLADVLDSFENDKPLVGTNPYRYTRVDKDGAKELSKLIKETDTIIAGFSSIHEVFWSVPFFSYRLVWFRRLIMFSKIVQNQYLQAIPANLEKILKMKKIMNRNQGGSLEKKFAVIDLSWSSLGCQL
jgi:hypothetical protein